MRIFSEMLLNPILARMLSMSISAGWLILAVMIFRVLTDRIPGFRRIPKWIRGVLWAMVALRLLLPFTITTRISLIPRFSTEMENRFMTLLSGEALIETESEHTYILTESAVGITEKEREVRIESTDYLPAEVLTGTEPTPSESSGFRKLVSYMGIIWILGAVLLLLYALISYLRLRKKVEVSAPLFDRTYLCDGIDTPFILGWIRPRIFLPSGMEPDTCGYVIAHEKAHLKRYDHIWKVAGYLILCAYWFCPLVWAAYLLFCRDIELACDERVIRDRSAQYRKSYSEALLSCAAPRYLLSACPLAFGETPVRARIRSIASYQEPTVWILFGAATLCVVLAVCFLTDPAVRRRPSEDPVVLPTESNAAAPSPIREIEATEIPEDTATAALTMRNAAWVYPVEPMQPSSVFGEIAVPPELQSKYSDQLNLKAEEGDPVYAVANAVVEETILLTDPSNEQSLEYGHYIVLRIDNETTVMYGHLDEIYVSPGQTVKKGDMIGTVGKTGMATGPNLSFAVYVNGTAVDPLG